MTVRRMADGRPIPPVDEDGMMDNDSPEYAEYCAARREFVREAMADALRWKWRDTVSVAILVSLSLLAMSLLLLVTRT